MTRFPMFAMLFASAPLIINLLHPNAAQAITAVGCCLIFAIIYSAQEIVEALRIKEVTDEYRRKL